MAIRMGRGVKAISVALLAAAGMEMVGCKVEAAESATAGYRAGLKLYHTGRPRCVWAAAKKMPMAAVDAPGNGMEALKEIGLVRMAGQGKATKYELTEAGFQAWTPDVMALGSGNFCYGHWEVATVDRVKRANESEDVVTYRYRLGDAAGWAASAAAQAEFAQVKMDMAGERVAEARMLNTTAGYRVEGEPKEMPAAR